MLLGLEENMLFIRRKHPIHSTLVLLPAFALNRRSLFTHGGDGVEPQNHLRVVQLSAARACAKMRCNTSRRYWSSLATLSSSSSCASSFSDTFQSQNIPPPRVFRVLGCCSSSSWNTTTKILMVGAEQNGGKQARASSKLTWSPLVLRFSLSLSVFAQLCVSDNSSAGQLFSSPQTFTRRQSSKTTWASRSVCSRFVHFGRENIWEHQHQVTLDPPTTTSPFVFLPEDSVDAFYRTGDFVKNKNLF